MAAAGATSATATPPPVTVTVELGTADKGRSTQTLVVKVSGQASSSVTILPKEGRWDYEELSKNLAGVKAKWPAVSAVTLVADNGTEYREVVKTMEVMRQQLPVVMLGGF